MLRSEEEIIKELEAIRINSIGSSMEEYAGAEQALSWVLCQTGVMKASEIIKEMDTDGYGT